MKCARDAFRLIVSLKGTVFRGKFRWLVVFAAYVGKLYVCLRYACARGSIIYNKIFRSWQQRDETSIDNAVGFDNK